MNERSGPLPAAGDGDDEFEARLRRDLAELAAVSHARPAAAGSLARPRRRVTVGVGGALVSLALVAGALTLQAQRDSTPLTTPVPLPGTVARLVPASGTPTEVEAALPVLARRLALAGFADAVVELDRAGAITIVTDRVIPRQVLERLSRPGRLEFRPVTDGPIPAEAVVAVTPTSIAGSTPVPSIAPGARICESLVDDATWFFDEHATNCYQLGPVALGAPNIVSAEAVNDFEWRVDVEFGDDRFLTDVAKPLVNQRVAIVLDDVVMSAPQINPGIVGRDVQITGGPFTEVEARALAAVLSSGQVLAVEFEVVEGADPTATSTTNLFGIDVPLPSNRIDDDGEPPRGNVDHWHTAFGINVCGTWLADPPVFYDRRVDPGLIAGIHSHGDGLIHIHPFSIDEAGARATLRRFLEYGGWMQPGSDGLDRWAPTAQCGAAADPITTVFLDGDVSGDGFDTRLGDQAVIVIGIGTGAEYPGDPPSTANLGDPADNDSATDAP